LYSSPGRAESFVQSIYIDIIDLALKARRHVSGSNDALGKREPGQGNARTVTAVAMNHACE